ncbi:MAG: type I-E CRISPR-associated protein Cse1/CasA, partial [bacterium]
MSSISRWESKTTEFNLLEEDWIPLLLRDGTYLWASPIKCLQEARRIKSIAAANPMDRLSILRFLLALLCSCRVHEKIDKLEGEEWVDLKDCIEQLNAEREYFKLFGKPPRFYQYRSSTADDDREKEKKKRLPSTYLIHEIPAGSNVPFFLKARDYNDGLCPQCCALGLLRLPLFTTMGGRGKKPGINGKPPVYFIPQGDSLSKTLMISLKIINSLNPTLGQPSWKNPMPRVEGNEVPLLKGLTWLPRVVWLAEPDSQESKQDQVCIYCGRRGPVVREMVYEGIKWAENLKWRDPHVFYEDDRPVVLPDESKPGLVRHTRISATARAALATFGDSLIKNTLVSIPSHGEGIQLWVVALVSDQNKYIEAVEQYFPAEALKTEALKTEA